jgi:hypothetical protein
MKKFSLRLSHARNGSIFLKTLPAFGQIHNPSQRENVGL